MNRGWHQAAQLWLLHTIVLTLALPAFGTTWHRVLPHEHILVGGTPSHHIDAMLDQIDATKPTLDDEASGPDPRWVHLPDPSGIIQVFSIAVGLLPPFYVPTPPLVTARLSHSNLYVSIVFLPPQDPPPIAALVLL